MALSMCIACKKAFIGSVQEEKVCPDCDVRLRELYPSVRGFLRNNDRESYTAQDISRVMSIALKDVEALISLGFLEYKTKDKHSYGNKKKQKSLVGKK